MNDGVIVVKMTRPMVSALLIVLGRTDIEEFPPAVQIELVSAVTQMEAWQRHSLPEDAAGIGPLSLSCSP